MSVQIDQSLQLLESPFTTHLLATRSPGAGDWKESQSATEPFYELCADASAEPRGLQNWEAFNTSDASKTGCVL